MTEPTVERGVVVDPAGLGKFEPVTTRADVEADRPSERITDQLGVRRAPAGLVECTKEGRGPRVGTGELVDPAKGRRGHARP